MSYKVVSLPIIIPVGEFCWDGHSEICTYFDNEGGTPSCNLDLGTLKYNKDDIVPKPEKCKELKSI